MKIFFDELETHQIQRLVINSLEQALYQAIVVIDGEEYPVWENPKRTVTTRNLVQMRERFANLEVPEMVLRQESSYDEMIGLQHNSASNRLEVPLARSTFPDIPD